MEVAGLGTAAKELFAALTEPGAGESLGLDGWLDVLSDSQEVLNVLAAVQAVAMAQVAAHDSEDQHGFGPRHHRGLGHTSLDAPDLVAARLGCSSHSAASRVGAAVAQVTTMPGLITAMAEGRLDQFRAAVVAEELADVPAQARTAVVAALDTTGRLTCETAGPLRRRVRRLLPPDVLAARGADDRERRGLHRSTASLGVDQWAAWLPVESSRPAWAAVTALAQDYVRAGQADTLAQARADALTDLILGRATTTVVLHPTVPLEALRDEATAAGDDLVPVGGFGAPGQTLVRRDLLRELAGLAGSRRRTRKDAAARGAKRVRLGEVLALAPGTGGVAGILEPGAADADGATLRLPKATGYRPSAEVERVVKARDGRCRFPGCHIPVRFVDVDHVTAYDHDRPAAGGATALGNLACLCRRHHRVKQRPGWRVALAADGSMTWTDPSGVRRTSWPDDHRPLSRSAHLGVPVVATPPVRPQLGSWEARLRAVELEEYSLLEDRLVDVLVASGHHVEPELAAHRDLPRAPRRRLPPREDGPRCRIRTDLSHATTPARTVVLHPDTLAELEARIERRSAPPF